MWISIFLLALAVPTIRCGRKCGECVPEKCQLPSEECLAGLVKDLCGCCYVCGRREGQLCDGVFLPITYPNGRYGTCGEHLECRLLTDLDSDDPPEAMCVCLKTETLCGSDNKTYDNECQLTEARYKQRNGLRARHRGPCISDATPPKEIISEPEFAEPIPNVTVSAGRDVSLPCVVDNLGTFRVAWIHTDRYTLLTLQNRVITRNSRYKVTHNSHRTWWLHISEVQERDKGEYMCQINTSPMKSQTGYIEVVVPPHIAENETSSDTEVSEGSDVSLRCVAKGSPNPEITWRREDNQEITIDKKKVTTLKGPYLNVTKVTRLQMGAYLCIAANGVQPSVSKRIVLNVNFAPMIWIPNQLVGAPVSTDVSLDCNLESFPQSVTYWNRDGGTMVLTNDKYNSVVLTTGLYKVTLRLTIRNLKPDDFGSYTCVAKNSLGETEGTIRLYEIPPPSSPSTSQGPEPLRAKSEKLRNGHPQSSQTRTEETGSTEVQYGPSPSLNASSFSSENYFPPTNFNTEPGAVPKSFASANLLYACSYYVTYFTLCQRFSFSVLS